MDPRFVTLWEPVRKPPKCCDRMEWFVRLSDLLHMKWPPDRRQPVVGLLHMPDTMLFYARMRLRMMAAKGLVALHQASEQPYRLAPL